ncbi:multidrug resistance-associated protein 1 [Aplysia californica]|uniref:ABC-type glutathione-S-conjugate transporter n=1 Tax=Aplysia californica TaxID=6500 RepID=A0ABM1A7T2_APLCA|nr:multidrug resistance-associated protein 1 [Aplysia californica]
MANESTPNRWTSFEEFCGYSPFMNKTLLLEDDYPHFTECFKEVGLIWIPCIAFLAGTPFYLVYLLYRKRVRALPAGFLHVSKMVLSFSLLCLSMAVLIVRGTDNKQGDIVDAEYVSEGLRAGCFLTSLCLLRMERLKGVVASYIHWFFWLVSFLATIVPFYSNVKESRDDFDNFGYVTDFIYFVLLLLQLLISSVAEKRPVDYRDLSEEVEYPSPELTASVPSLLTFWWIVPLIFKGFRKTLTDNDVFSLIPDDTSDVVVPKFEAQWKAEVDRVEAHNKKIRPPAHSFYTDMTPNGFGKGSSEKAPLLAKEKPEKEKQPKSPYKTASLGNVFLRTYGTYFLIVMIMKVCSDLLLFATPKVTEALMEHIALKNFNVPSERDWKGYVLAGSFLVIQLVSAVGSNKATLMSRRLGMHIKAAAISAIYKKALTVSSIGAEKSAGEIVNLMAVDTQKYEDLCLYLPMVISTPFQLGLAIYMLYDQLEVAVFAGMGTMLLAVPFNAVVGVFIKKYQELLMAYKDQRMKLLGEVLEGIKVLKLYAWEGSFQKKIEEIREKEVKVLSKFSFMIAVTIFVFTIMPYIIKLVSWGVYIEISDEGYLSPTVAFVSMSLFNMLNQPLTMLPLFFPMFIQAIVATTRISAFLNEEDIKQNVKKDPSAVKAVRISNGNFTWDKSQALPTLRDINVAIKSRGLVAVVGTVGSGKSSLLSAILGEMEKLTGTVIVKSSIAYVPQEAWIQNATVRDNILFGSPLNYRRYDEVIEACALKSDLEILPAGDRTEIGEKGINVSGGQKQRVSLARAVYSDQDIFLLDDPLSAVDSHVGKHIFTNVLSHRGLLKDKTRILVTHGVHWLPLVDQIVVLSDGRVSEVGSYEELLSKDGAFAQFLKEHLQDNMEDSSEGEVDPEVEALKRKVIERLESVSGPVMSGHSSQEDEQTKSFGNSGSLRRRKSQSAPRRRSSVQPKRQRSAVDEILESSLNIPKKDPVAGERLIEEEKGAEGKVKLDIFIHYMKAIGPWTCGIAVFLYACHSGASIFTQIWLTEWTGDDYLANASLSHESYYDEKTNKYLLVYGAGGVGSALFVLGFSVIAAFTMTRAAKRLHMAMLHNIMRAPMAFFDTTPIGRIMNRFSRDSETVDFLLPNTIQNTMEGISQVIVTIVIISYSTPIFLSVLGPLAIIYILVLITYIPTSRQLRRIDSVTRSPVYVHFSETQNGASSIRAYGAQERFIRQSKARVDHNFKFYFAGVGLNTWLSLVLQNLGNVVVFAAAIFAVTNSDIETEIVGMSVTTAMQMTVALQMLVQQLSEAEINIVSVERMREYTYTPREDDWVYPNRRPDPEWPQKGNVEFNEYKTRYRPGLDLVLRDISCQIKGGEKIGIVGRTGAGKSSMTVALFRIIEAAGGKIVIDGLNISDMGLHDLRSRLTILPQEPVLFSGTLRMNLDPIDQHTDAQVWSALEHAHLKIFVEGLQGGLYYECGEGGSNLSVGQRQLVCLARTLLRKTKILVLDEATAAVDFETDELIQKTIRTQFQDSTILTIAHRLNTILDYDRVMVLDRGYIKEFAAPSALLSDPSTIFYGMARDAGIV